MYRFEITQKDAGQRLDKFLGRMLPEAGSGFLHKMLRKKNITLNEKKADGAERLTAGDSVMIFFSEETLLKFMGRQTLPGNSAEEQTDGTSSVGTMLFGVDRAAVRQEYLAAYAKLQKIAVLYENAHVLLADKPAGVLSQKAEHRVSAQLRRFEGRGAYLFQAFRVQPPRPQHQRDRIVCQKPAGSQNARRYPS